MDKKVSLTGIKPTGSPHLGNYFGAIKPGLQLAKDYFAYYFIADYHGLNSIRDPKELHQWTREIAGAWLACGLDPEKVNIYRQSSVPETFELTVLLSCFTPKGLMNRAHAYKAMLQKNAELERDPDDGVNIGLFTYPILMAADILLFDADYVPVGQDQQQHVEMAVDIAQSINYVYNKELFRIPKPLIRKGTSLVQGLDGRKMSKSYNNTIPMFLPQNQLRKMIMRIVTNSQTVDEPKDPDTCNVFALYKLFASEEELKAMRERYRAGGMGWGDAKTALFEKMNEVLTPFRENFNELMKNPKEIDRILDEGSERIRPRAIRKIEKLRRAIGVR